jgi:hypothetical protein
MSGDGLDLRARMEFDAAAGAKARDKKRRGFVLAVVNGADRDDLREKRDDFVKSYTGWFPPVSEADCRSLDAVYRGELYEWRRLETNEASAGKADDIPMESPHPKLGPHVAILRYKLRVIWKTAQTNPESAERRVGYLQTDIRRHLRGEWGCAAHYHDVRAASEWLAENVSKLKICKNPSCSSPFFIRKEKNQQYCCSDCSAEGQRLGWESRSRERKKVLSPEGKAAISKAQKERHARNAANNADKK